MNIKSATINVVLDSAEIAEAVKPLLEAKLSQLGKVSGMKLEDVAVEVTFAPEIIA